MDSNFGAKGDEFILKGDKSYKGILLYSLYQDLRLEIYLVASRRELKRLLKFINRQQPSISQPKDVLMIVYSLGEDVAEAYKRCVMCSKALQSGEAADFLVEAANAIRKINTAGIY